MQIIYFKAECAFPELLPSSPVSLQEVILTRDGEIISSFSDLKLKTLPFYLFHLVPIGFRKIEHQVGAQATAIYSFPPDTSRAGNTGWKHRMAIKQ